jgi:integrase
MRDEPPRKKIRVNWAYLNRTLAIFFSLLPSFAGHCAAVALVVQPTENAGQFSVSCMMAGSAGDQRWQLRPYSRRRDATMVLVAYRHGLRAGELVTLRWDAADFAHGRLHVSRLKSSAESVHPLSGRELRALRRLRRDQDPASPFIFTSERGAPFTTAGFRKMVARLGVAAHFDFPVHPHMLRHACGFKLANDGVDTRSLQAYLGHKNIQHTVRYTELAPTRFKHFWRD